MIWDDVKAGMRLGADEVVQRHQTHDYPCVELIYEHNGQIKSFIGSEDHLIKVCTKNLPARIKQEIKTYCTGKIARTEDVMLSFLSDASSAEKIKISQYVVGITDGSEFDEIVEVDNAFTFYIGDKRIKVEVTTIPLAYDSQKIDEEHYWLPLIGLVYLVEKYGELDI